MAVAPLSQSPVHPGTDRAFTLLEVVLAMAIIAIALVTLFGSQARSLALILEAQFNNTAPLLAAEKVAELALDDTLPLTAAGDFGEEFPGYRWQLTVARAEFPGLAPETDLGEWLSRLELRVEGTVPGHSYTLVWFRLRERE
jgi:general secretion pathway protein I